MLCYLLIKKKKKIQDPSRYSQHGKDSTLSTVFPEAVH